MGLRDKIEEGQGGGGGAKVELPPPHFDPIKVPTAAEASDLSEKGKTQNAWVVFNGENKSEAELKKILDSGKDSKLPKLWSYQVQYRNIDDKDGVSCKEENDQILSAVQGFQSYNNLATQDESPRIYSFTKDGDDADTKPDRVEARLSGIQANVDHGESVEEVGGDNSGIDPFNYSQSIARHLDKLDDMGKKLKFMIAELMAAIAGNNWDMILQVARILDMKFKNFAGRIATLVGQAMGKAGDANREMSDKLAKLLSSKKPDAGEIEKLRTAMDTNRTLISSTYQNLMRDSVNMVSDSSEFSNSIAARIERINSSYTRWS